MGGGVAFFSFWICFIYLRYKRVYIHTNITHIYKMNNYFSSFSQKNGQYRVWWSKVCRCTGYCVQRKYWYFSQIKLGWELADLKMEGVIMGLLSLLNYFFSRKCYDTKQLKMHRNSYIGIIWFLFISVRKIMYYTTIIKIQFQIYLRYTPFFFSISHWKFSRFALDGRLVKKYTTYELINTVYNIKPHQSCWRSRLVGQHLKVEI